MNSKVMITVLVVVVTLCHLTSGWHVSVRAGSGLTKKSKILNLRETPLELEAKKEALETEMVEDIKPIILKYKPELDALFPPKV